MTCTVFSIEMRVREYIEETFLFRLKSGTLKNDESLFSTGIVDSFGVLSMVTFLEDAFDFIFQDSEVDPENLETIDKIVRFIQQKI